MEEPRVKPKVMPGEYGVSCIERYRAPRDVGVLHRLAGLEGTYAVALTAAGRYLRSSEKRPGAGSRPASCSRGHVGMHVLVAACVRSVLLQRAAASPVAAGRHRVAAAGQAVRISPRSTTRRTAGAWMPPAPGWTSVSEDGHQVAVRSHPRRCTRARPRATSSRFARSDAHRSGDRSRTRAVPYPSTPAACASRRPPPGAGRIPPSPC